MVLFQQIDGVGNAAECAVEQLISRHLFNVVVPHEIEHLGEDAEVSIEIVFL